MSITVYPITIEAVDDDNSPVFKMRVVDESVVELECKVFLSNGDVDEFLAAIKKAIIMAGLK